MNLKALQEKVKNLVDYSPDLAAFNDQMDALINDAYLSIWGAKRWNFAQKSSYLYFQPDILPNRDKTVGGPDITASVQKGSRQVVFSQLISRLQEKPLWEGTIFFADGVEYIISKVLADDTILLTSVYLGDTSNTLASWQIKKRYYSLPQDCLELLNLSHRDAPLSSGASAGTFPPRGKAVAISPRRDEELNLREDWKAAWAEAFIWSQPKNIPPGEKLTLTSAVAADNNGFPAGSSLEVCWCFEKDGRFGPLSTPTTITFPTGENAPVTYILQANFISWDDQPIFADAYQTKDTAPTQYEGYRKVVFWNSNFNRTTGERLGLPAWKHFNIAGLNRNATNYLNPIIVDDVFSSVQIPYFASIDPGNSRYIEIDGQHLQIRPYPRVDAWDKAIIEITASVNYSAVIRKYLRAAEMRYFFKPPLLAEQTDSPLFPYEFHQLIVYKVLEEVYLKLGNAQMATLYTRKMEKDMKDLEKRYVDHIDTSFVRGRFAIGLPSGESFAPYDWQSLRKVT